MSLLLVVSLGAGAQEDESLQTYLREVMTAERPHVPNSRTCLSSLPNRSRRSWNTCIAMAR